MSESTADIIARMQARMRSRAASPATVRKLVTDTSSGRANAGVPTSGYGAANSLSSRRRGGKYPQAYRPRAEDYAGMDPVTARPAFGSVKPSGGRKIAGAATVTRRGKRVPSVPLLQARADSENEGMRQEVTRRYNLALDAGEIPAPGIGKSTPATRTVALPGI
jgi:hypothetical protein